MENDPMEWLEDPPLQCGYFPSTSRCENHTKMIAFGANDEGLFYWFPICTTCAIESDTHKWQIAQPFGMHASDVEAE